MPDDRVPIGIPVSSLISRSVIPLSLIWIARSTIAASYFCRAGISLSSVPSRLPLSFIRRNPGDEIAQRLGHPSDGTVPPDVAPVAVRRSLEVLAESSERDGDDRDSEPLGKVADEGRVPWHLIHDGPLPIRRDDDDRLDATRGGSADGPRGPSDRLGIRRPPADQALQGSHSGDRITRVVDPDCAAARSVL